MSRFKIKKSGIIILATLLLSINLSAQIKFKPIVRSITDGHEFVMVIKGNEKIEKPERVVMNDFKASEEAFNPNKISTYPSWRFTQLNIMDTKTGKITRHVAIINVETGKYYHSTGSMKSEEDFIKDTEKKEDGSYKDYWKAVMYYFQPEIQNEDYIWFRIPNKENTSMVVTPGTWNTREVKLVLANYNN
jgi:predicted SnoaL-like aldol condensation-catalyzing enzyme